MYFSLKTALDIPLHPNDQMIECPFCKGNMLVVGEKYTCYSCFKTGNIVDFLSERDKISHKKAEWKALKNKPDGKKIKMILSANKYAAEYYSAQQGNYFKSRKISGDTALKFCLGYAPSDVRGLLDYLKKKGVSLETAIEAGLLTDDEEPKPFFRNRAVFPIFSEKGKIVGFGARRLSDENKKVPKYLNTGENLVFHKRDLLYGLNFINKAKSVYLVEGYMDVIALHQAGINNAVAALGTAIGEHHCTLLREQGVEKIILTMDGDEAGVKSALKSIPMLIKYFDVSVIKLNGAKDPDEYMKNHSKEDFLAIKQQNAASFFVQNSTDKINEAIKFLL